MHPCVLTFFCQSTLTSFWIQMEETWFIIIVTICIVAFLKSIISLSLLSSKNSYRKKLPPGPPTVPILGNLLLLRKSFSELETILRELKLKYGPIITLKIGSNPSIFVGSHSLAYKTLVQNGVVFSDRPRGLATSKITTSNQRNISSAPYGPVWRLLRRNFTSGFLTTPRITSFSHTRRWALFVLIQRLLESGSSSGSATPVKVIDHFQYFVLCLLVVMCFGNKLDENQMKRIEMMLRSLIVNTERFNVLNFWPRLGKIVFYKLWKELIELRRNQEELLIPLIHDRKRLKEENRRKEQDDAVVAYVDTLLDLQLPDENRKLDDAEMVTLCSELLIGGTDTTATALQWIMANLVKYPEIQAKLYEEISSIMGPPPPLKGEEESIVVVKEEDLQKMTYLKAVVMEALRRHPPAHFVLPHALTEDVELDGYVLPKNSVVNFMVAEMGLDPKVWEDPMEFKPERFLMPTTGDHQLGKKGNISAGEVFDITGSKEIKMMPFGAGRRICPGAGLALLHLEFFVANLVWYFQWRAGDGDDVDLSDKQEFTVVMKNPLRAHLSPRFKVGG